MPKLMSNALVLSVFLLAAPTLAGGAQDPSQFRITHEARALQPGEVVSVTVRGPGSPAKVEGRIFDRTIAFSPNRRGDAWNGLIGIDLETRAGSYTFTLRVTDREGGELVRDYPLTVRSKTFPTRHLTVEEKFVTPPEEVQSRIAGEAKRVGAVLAAVTPERYWTGSFLRPVPGPVISAFGKRNIMNGKPRSPHSGTDFQAASGTPIKAPNAGAVVLSADLYFSGNTVILDHGQGLFSYFAHLSRFSCQEGDRVARGGVVGLVGATGRVTGPHLHWTVRLGGARVDPLSLLWVVSRMETPGGPAPGR
jgi:murein DD-endopeptidase MepM/ murein hydrolase activator NlpD